MPEWGISTVGFFFSFFVENLNALTLLKITKVSTRAFFGRGVVKIPNL